MGRSPCCQKTGLKRGRWTVEEDQILIKYILDNGEGSWRSLPRNAGLLRWGKSCRLRWINYLKTDLKRGNISPQEEDLIIKLHATLGNRWSLIASQLPGRTDNEIKNHWNSHLRRSIDSWRRPLNDSLPQHILDNLAKLLVKPSPSTQKGSKKNIAPTTEESSKATIRKDTIYNGGDHTPPTPDMCTQALRSRNSWGGHSFQSTISLKDQQEGGKELEMSMEPLVEGADDFREPILFNNETLTFTFDSTLLMTPQRHSLDEMQNTESLDVCVMNDLLDFSTNHAEMDYSWLPTSSSTMDTTKNQPSPSSLYTFDQLMNMSDDWNWDNCNPSQDHDLMNHEVSSFVSWLWDDSQDL